MNLKNNKITMGELWDHPGASAVLRRKIPVTAKNPPRGAARTVTLEQLMAVAEPYVKPKLIQDILKELQQL